MANIDPTVKPVDPIDFENLKQRMNLIVSADPEQYHNDFSLKRYLRAFKSVDAAFQAILKTNKWRIDYGVQNLSETTEEVQSMSEAKKARVLRHRDLFGRPVLYVPARNHSANATEEQTERLKKFIVYCLEKASKNCFEEIIDNFCIVFDLRDFGLNCMDYNLLKNMIWLLSRHYPERLGSCLILNAPTLFSTCWPVIRGWLDENTAGKVIFINSEEQLCNHLIPDILPTDM